MCRINMCLLLRFLFQASHFAIVKYVSVGRIITQTLLLAGLDSTPSKLSRYKIFRHSDSFLLTLTPIRETRKVMTSHLLSSSFSFGLFPIRDRHSRYLHFYDIAFVLRSDALPATNPLFRGKTGPPVCHIKVEASC